MTHDELKLLEKFIDKIFDEITSKINFPPRNALMATNIYEPFFGMFAHSPFTVSTHVYYRGCVFEEDKALLPNQVRFGSEIFTFDLKTSPHWCQNHLVKYIGFREIYNYCSICDRKFSQ